MRLTIIQSPAEFTAGDTFWDELADRQCFHPSNALLLNELPFGNWLSRRPDFEESLFQESVKKHQEAIQRFGELQFPVVLGSRSAIVEGKPVNMGFIWQDGHLVDFHAKQYFPHHEGFYEDRWYLPSQPAFQVQPLCDLNVAMLICTDAMFTEWGRHYRRHGAHLIVVPRATSSTTVDRWKAALATLAIVSGCYVASSNRVGQNLDALPFGGAGLMFSPRGKLLAETNTSDPVVSCEVDPDAARLAQQDYPCNVVEPSDSSASPRFRHSMVYRRAIKDSEKLAANYILLTHAQIDMERLTVRESVLRRIVDLVVRRGRSSSPGFAVVPNTLALLGDRERAIAFQQNLMQQLQLWLQKEAADALLPQPYLDVDERLGCSQGDTLGVEAFRFSAFANASTQAFHMDNLRQSYVSLIYGPNRNIQGGVPEFLDALRLQESEGLGSITDVVKLQRLPKKYTEIFTPLDREGVIYEKYGERLEPFVTRLDDLDFETLPMVMFTNRLKDGILHGATPPESVRPHEPAERPISYCAIKHLPFSKDGPFAATHRLWT